MSYTEDWTTWAGDHPEEAEAQLRAERGHLYADTEPETCDVEGHEFESGVCLICDVEDEDYEPSDAQIPGTYEIRKAVAA